MSYKTVSKYLSSIHITLGLVLFIRYVVVTAFLTFFNITDVIKDRITGYLLPFVAYITLFLAFGIVIFQSVEKEYFLILKYATLGFAILQITVLVILYILRFLPAYEYHQFPFLPISITDGYVHSGFHSSEPRGAASSSASASDHLSGEGYSSDFLPKLTRSPSGTFPTVATGEGKGSGGHQHERSSASDKRRVSAEVSQGPDDAESRSQLSELDFTQPETPISPQNKWMAEVYTLLALIVMTVVSVVYLTSLFLYLRQLMYEDSGHVFGHAQSVTRNVAFYVQPQFTQSGNSDNKLTNPPSPALRGKPSLQNQELNCAQSTLNTQFPNEFLPQQRAGQQRQQSHVGNHLNCFYPNSVRRIDTPQSQCQTPGQNNLQQRSPVPPAREMQQNIQTPQQQQVITIYPQKGGGYTSSSSSPRMQVKFAKPLEQELNPSALSHPHTHGGDWRPPPEPTRSCLVNSGNVQQWNASPPNAHMMPPQSKCQQRFDPRRGYALPQVPVGQYQPPQYVGIPPHHQSQLSFLPSPPHSHIQPCSPYAHPPPMPHMSYHGKSRAQQQCYNEMVDNSSYLTFSGNPNTSNVISAPPPPHYNHYHHPSLMASGSHTYPHYSQRRPSGSMV